MATLDKKSNNLPVYKVGKNWIFVSLISAGVLFTLSNSVAYADTTVDSPVAAEVNTRNTSQPQSPTTPHKPDEFKTPEDTAPKEPSSDTNNRDNLELPSEETPKKSSSVHTATMALPPTKPTGRSSLASPMPEKPQPVVPTPTATSPAPVTPVAPKPQTQVAPSQSINDWMPNPQLQQLVAKTLKKRVTELIPDDLLALTKLVISHYSDGGTGTSIDLLNINKTNPDNLSSYSLKGLEHATNLTYLDLSFDVTDIMFSKYAHGNITDISPLEKLTKLAYLDLTNNYVANVTPLAKLSNLKVLKINGNSICDFSSLDYKQFTSLTFGEQEIIMPLTYTVNPNKPSITVPQLFKLPHGLDISTQIDVSSDYNDKVVTMLLATIDGRPVARVFARGGQIVSDTGETNTANKDNSVTFINIPSQITPGQTSNSFGTTIQNPVHYYLIEDFVGSNKQDLIDVRIFIPYNNVSAAKDVTVQYLDENELPIKKGLVLGDKQLAGDTYTLTPDQLAVPGYAYDTERNKNTSTTITFTDQAQTITLYYKKDTTKPITPPVTPTSTVTVTVHYQDEQGRQLLTDAKLTGQPGTSYHVTTPTLTGYQLTSASNPIGTFGNHDQTIIVTYHQLSTSGGGDTSSTSETPTDSSQPDTIKPVKPQQALPTPGNSAATISVANKHPQHPATASKNSKPMTLTEQSQPALPQTSEHRTSPLIGLGLLLASLIGITARFRKRN